MKERNINLDIIRCMAIFCVISVHFFANSKFYDTLVMRWDSYLMVTIRTMSMVCVPLFLILTGYLMCKKELCAKYYKGIVRILVIHGICTILCYAYRHFFQDAKLDWQTVAKGFFSNQGYSWYVGLYMGLFCLIPFLNLIYNSLDEKWKKQVLLLTMAGLTTLPSVTNYFFKILPDTFTQLYPVTYYFIGAYIREYKDDWKKWRVFMLYCSVILINSVINIVISHGEKMAWKALNDWGGMENVLSASLLFVFLAKINTERIPAFAVKAITKISELSFGMYLLSWIFDQYAYAKLNSIITVPEERWKFYIIMVLFVFVCSMILSWIVNLIYKLIVKLWCKVFNMESNKHKTLSA